MRQLSVIVSSLLHNVKNGIDELTLESIHPPDATSSGPVSQAGMLN